jgi:hypothetical protein
MSSFTVCTLGRVWILVDGARLQALRARLSALGETEAELHLAYADICGGQVELLTA